MTDSHWDSELAEFLNDLSAVQDATLEILAEKRKCIVDKNMEGLAAVGDRERQVIGQLEQCLERRDGLLRRAAKEGFPSDSIQSLTEALPGPQRRGLRTLARHSASRARLLQHQSLTNWVLVQRTLLHLTQMIEIIATGGRMKPTYGKDDTVRSGGTLVDHAV